MEYPLLRKGATVGVTAPSSGTKVEMYSLIKEARETMERSGYRVVIGETAWTQHKAKSAIASKRANEFQTMMEDEDIDIIIPPWGGELLIEILEKIDFAKLPRKWILGYSDISLLLLATTLQTGIATAHGVNLIDLRGEYSDDTTAMWEAVLSTKQGNEITQYSSEKYQKEWQFDNPTPCVYHLTEKTNWRTISNGEVTIQGRFLGGCIDVIRHLIGTPFGNVEEFRRKYTKGEPIIWYLENCELSTADVRRSLVQMKLAGWFDNCTGILFGRSSANMIVDDYTIEDVYCDLASELGVPIVYDIDCGHVPPQITFVNGAYGEVKVKNGKGIVKQYFI